MKRIILIILVILGNFLFSPAHADKWEYAGASYSDYAGCPNGGKASKTEWREPVDSKFDKAVLYTRYHFSWNGKEVERIDRALLQWSMPFVKPSTGKIQMILHAEPIGGAKNMTARVLYQGYTEHGEWGTGGGATSRQPHSWKGKQHWARIDTEGPDRVQKYGIRVSITDGGSCSAKDVAIYRFHRIKEFVDDVDDFEPPHSNSRPQGQALGKLANSGRDYVGRSTSYKNNGKADAVFRASINAPGQVITGIVVENVNGQRAVWDTYTHNSFWLGVAVIDGRAINDRDGTVNYRLGQAQAQLEYFCEDNGSVRGRRTDFNMTISFASGDKLMLPFKH
jgi:hypothetical protein